MKLGELLQGIDYKIIPDTVDISQVEINNIASDSRRVREGDLFIAARGEIYDGHDFIAEAVSRGARAVLSEEEFTSSRALQLITHDTRRARAILADNYFAHPAGEVKLIGITGTNGKTTTTYLINSILNSAGEKGGIIGTINYQLGQRLIPSVNTTPGAIELRQYLAEMRSNRINHAVIEASSHALSQERLTGLDFFRAIFTNLTSDHLDYHRNIEEYFNAKAKLFTSLDTSAVALINIDDKFGRRLIKLAESDILTYAVQGKADITAKDIILSNQSISFTIRFPSGAIDIKSSLLGQHNVYNILAAASCAYSMGIELPVIKKGIEDLLLVPGRLEPIDCGQDFRVFVDYAHTENALYNILSSIRNFHSGRLSIVFGCGGDRDQTKRSPMGKVADKYCDRIIITSDNPRSEDPLTVAEEIAAGVGPKADCRTIIDRFQAILEALSRAQSGEVVVIAGKGHEAYQVLRNTVEPFDDREVCRRILQNVKMQD